MRRNSIIITYLLVAATMLISCGKEDDVEISQSAYLRQTQLDATATLAVVEYRSSCETSWSATIDEGAEFASFDYLTSSSTTSGVVAQASQTNLLYLYLAANNSDYGRTLTVTLAFDGGESFTMSSTQLSSSAALASISDDQPYNAKGEPRWPEIPLMATTSAATDYIYVTHTTSTIAGDEVRNFSLCYDPQNHAAAWVAYPLHAIYMGDVGRNEDWEYDPLITTSVQPNLNSSYTGSYDRGHQLASADRQATVAMNKQTFYFSNMTPQLSSLNQNVWATLESRVRDHICSDTLYVVTGADFASSTGSTTDRDGMTCPLPGAYFKAMLRTRSGVSGKAVGECEADELQAVGFWYEHRSYSSLATPVSVAQVEALCGFTLFDDIPSDVKASYDPSLWEF